MQDYREFLHEVLIPEDRLQARIRELGAEISRDYAGQEILLVCLLKGSVFFLTDLLKRLSTPVAVDFLQVRSYAGTSSTGNFELVRDLSSDIEGRDVLLFEDVVDTGLTLRKLLGLLGTRQPRSLKICCLIDKQERREVDVPLDYVGFVVEKGFLVGYGLDCGEQSRTLPEIFVLEKD